MNKREFIKNALVISPLFLGSTIKLISEILEDKNLLIFNSIIQKAKIQKWHQLDINNIVTNVAIEFLATPYVGNTLDQNLKETCTVNLNGLDCVTFFENSLNIARIIKSEKYSYDDFINSLTFTRYRDGKLSDYSSRLHYTSDWIVNNIKKNVIIDICETMNTQIYNPNVYYMSQNPDKYLQLKNDTILVDKIKEIEQNINKQTIYFIPKDQIIKYKSKIKSGDIIAILTSFSGLDYSHVGLAYIENNNIRFLHASSSKKQVILDINLIDYLQNKKNDIGISVLRPI